MLILYNNFTTFSLELYILGNIYSIKYLSGIELKQFARKKSCTPQLIQSLYIHICREMTGQEAGQPALQTKLPTADQTKFFADHRNSFADRTKTPTAAAAVPAYEETAKTKADLENNSLEERKQVRENMTKSC